MHRRRRGRARAAGYSFRVEREARYDLADGPDEFLDQRGILFTRCADRWFRYTAGRDDGAHAPLLRASARGVRVYEGKRSAFLLARRRAAAGTIGERRRADQEI